MNLTLQYTWGAAEDKGFKKFIIGAVFLLAVWSGKMCFT